MTSIGFESDNKTEFADLEAIGKVNLACFSGDTNVKNVHPPSIQFVTLKTLLGLNYLNSSDKKKLIFIEIKINVSLVL